LLTVKSQCSGNSEAVDLQQQRYFYDREKLEAGSRELWQIPLCMKTAANSGAEQCELMTTKQRSFTLQGCSPWVYVNANVKGFYRSGYSSEAIKAMAKVVESALTPGERIMLLADVWSSVRVDREPIGDYLGLAEGLQSDRNSTVLNGLFQQLRYIDDYLVTDADRQAYEVWVRQLLSPIAQDVGWQPKPGESEDRAALRGELMRALGGVAHDPEVEALSRKVANQYFADPGSVDHELAGVALRIAAANGDQAFYDKLVASMKSAKTPEEYFNAIFALGRFSDPKLIEETLQFAISPQVRSQDAPYLISAVMQNPAAQKQAWSFVQANWDAIEKLGGAFAGGTIVQAAGSFCDAAMRDQVQAFFTTHPAPAAERSLKQTSEQIKYCVDMKTQQGAELASWLPSHKIEASK
jgi:aminopeptidase N